MADWVIRDVTVDDVESVVAVNAANEPEVGPLDVARVELFLSSADRFRLVELDGEIVGVFVGLVEGLDYPSPNYQWFAQRHARFAYVDRIALQPAARGLGAAAGLYDEFETWARGSSRPVVCAEVNTVPPNPRSLAFHRRRGFAVVDEIAPYGGDERVAMVEMVL
ncbi:GNAT family N-acetyltransferase [Actinospongicola halichondriae]|uniref:GNAT family N-acetyltransferase n=1 Tax=Actinospongicola halichondriae TaxID=3236844 RepID=UPI003D4C8A88